MSRDKSGGRGVAWTGSQAARFRFLVQNLGLLTNFIRWRGETWFLARIKVSKKCHRCGRVIPVRSWVYFPSHFLSNRIDLRRLCLRCAHLSIPHAGETGEEIRPELPESESESDRSSGD